VNTYHIKERNGRPSYPKKVENIMGQAIFARPNREKGEALPYLALIIIIIIIIIMMMMIIIIIIIIIDNEEVPLKRKWFQGFLF